MSTFSVQTIAREIKAAQDKTTQLTPFTSRFSDFDAASAYEVARLIHETRMSEGAVPVGRKIGFTNPDMWHLYGVREPIWAYIYDKTVVPFSETRIKCDIEHFAEPRIEPEIVAHFRMSPPITNDIAEILDCIDWIAHGIEIVQSHFPGWKFRAPDTIADWALHGTLLIGKPQDTSRLGPDLILRLERFSVTLLCNGIVREVGRGSNVLGSPLIALSHLIAILAARPPSVPIQSNELVTTGTLTKALTIRSGETWSTVIEGIALPDMNVEFEDLS
ncbi:MAG TPA: decarboxylase [Nitrospirota bacterium]|nr:decarboxylase [Nitrospirota bacterium]